MDPGLWREWQGRCLDALRVMVYPKHGSEREKMNDAELEVHIDDLVREQHESVAPTAAAVLLAGAVAGNRDGHMYGNFQSPPYRLALLAKGLSRLRRLDGPRGPANRVLWVLSGFHRRSPLRVDAENGRYLAILEPVFADLYARNKVRCGICVW